MEHLSVNRFDTMLKSEQQVLQLLRTQPGLTISDLARASNLGKATVSRVVARLRADNHVEECAQLSERQGRGRAGTGLRVRPEAELYVGLHIRTGRVECVLADGAQDIITAFSKAVEHRADREARLQLLEDAIAEALNRANRSRTRLRGVGVAIATPVHPVTHALGPAVRLPEWDRPDISVELAARLGVPVEFSNDSNCSAMFLFASGGLKPGESCAYVHLDVGVGGAVVLEGRIWQGHTGRAGNFGHISFDPEGEYCRCGGRGCYEKYLSLPAFLGRVTPLYGEKSLDEILALIEQQDHSVERVVQESGAILGSLLANLSRSIDPPAFVVGGPLTRLGEIYRRAASDQLHSINPAAGEVRFAAATNLPEIGATALGAVALLISTMQP